MDKALVSEYLRRISAQADMTLEILDDDILDKTDIVVYMDHVIRNAQIVQGHVRADKSRCPYTFAHTRQWCGYEQCRDS